MSWRDPRLKLSTHACYFENYDEILKPNFENIMLYIDIWSNFEAEIYCLGLAKILKLKVGHNI